MKSRTGTFYFLTAVIIFPMFMSAQHADTNKPSKPDSAYIESMNGYLTCRLSLNNDIKGFHVNNNLKNDFEPNDNNVLRFSASYRWLSFSYGLAPKFIPGNDDDSLKGKTGTTSFSLNLNFNHWVQHLAFNRVKGYYLANASAYPDSWEEGENPYLQFPDLVYKSYSGQTAYKFNKNFSFNALSSQTERQLKRAGTFMPALVYNDYIIDNKIKLTGQNSSQKTNNFELLIAAGYFYTYVINRQFYISAGVFPAAGFITTRLLTRYPDINYTTHYTNAIYRFDGIGALGYNAKRFYTGAQLIYSNERYNQTKKINVIISNELTYQVFIGYRFNAPRFLIRSVDKAEEKIPAF